MKFVVVLFLAAIVGAEALTTEQRFLSWMVRHKKVYPTVVEIKKRQRIFADNSAIVSRLNEVSKGEAVFALNEWADLTQSEWSEMFLHPMNPGAYKGIPTEKVSIEDIPDTWDWRDHGAVTPVKNQGFCGSCYSFSAVANMEGQWALANHTLTSFSEQQVVDCDRTCDPDDKASCDDGCFGGEMPNVFRFVIESNGIESETEYPYKAHSEKCLFSQNKSAAHFNNITLMPQDEELIRQAVYQTGPLSVAVDATWWQFYLWGIWNHLPCCLGSPMLNHGVAIVGYGGSDSTPYWIVKNSWGTRWGEKGFIRIVRDKNKCGISDFVSTIHV